MDLHGKNDIKIVKIANGRSSFATLSFARKIENLFREVG